MPRTLPADYASVTELPGGRASRLQMARLRHRYQLAAAYAAGGDVLEVGCGAGVGLGWLAHVAKSVVGGDYTAANLHLAREHYSSRVPLFRLDAAVLPFCARSFDLIVMFEALYYLARPEKFIAECRRLLRPGGALLIGCVNPEWNAFHPSPFAERYFSAAALRQLVDRGGFHAEIFGAFRESRATSGALARLKRIAGAVGLIPKTMRGREILKRLVFGPLEVIPAELLPDRACSHSPQPMLDTLRDSGPHRDYTILYAFGRLPLA